MQKLHSNRHQHPIFYRPDALPVAQTTASNHGREKEGHLACRKSHTNNHQWFLLGRPMGVPVLTWRGRAHRRDTSSALIALVC